MIDVKSIGIEVKGAVILGALALILSMATGLIVGISFGVVLVRALIATIVFGGLGFGAVQVLKKYVPEIGGISLGQEPDGTSLDLDPDGEVDADFSEGESAEGLGEMGAPETEGGGEGFTEMDSDSLPRVAPQDSELDSPLDTPGESGGGSMNPAQGQMGKHVIADEDSFVKYEPKLMAEAVRTMLSKDEE